MQLAIVQNPHIKKPKELWDLLNAQDKDYDEEMDREGFSLFKDKLRQSSSIVVK